MGLNSGDDPVAVVPRDPVSDRRDVRPSVELSVPVREPDDESLMRHSSSPPDLPGSSERSAPSIPSVQPGETVAAAPVRGGL